MFERLKYFFFNISFDWQIGIAVFNSRQFVENQYKLPKIKWLKCSFDVFQADPFGIEIDDIVYVFYEEFKKSKDYGIIKCLTLNTNLKIIKDKTIIDDNIHKSFPFVFKHEYKYYMIPENSSGNGFFVYECIEFPFKWEKKLKLMDFPISDAVLFEKESTYYLLYTKAKNTLENKHLYLKSSKVLFESWDNKNETLVKNDESNSRNAGQIFTVDNINYRVSQNCFKRYGESIKVNRINNLNNNQLSESFVSELAHKKFGIHTINFTENYVLVDRQIERRKIKSIKEIFNQLYRKL